MPNNLLEKVIYISNEDYETLVSAGTVEIGGKTLTYDENIVYITPEKAATIAEDGLMSAEDKAKLDAIESGAQANVQADWNQTDASADDYIKNKLRVDADLSLTSANPVQNKVISAKLNGIDNAITNLKKGVFTNDITLASASSYQGSTKLNFVGRSGGSSLEYNDVGTTLVYKNTNNNAIKFPAENGTLATQEYVNKAIADAVNEIKALLNK